MWTEKNKVYCAMISYKLGVVTVYYKRQKIMTRTNLTRKQVKGIEKQILRYGLKIL